MLLRRSATISRCGDGGPVLSHHQPRPGPRSPGSTSPASPVTNADAMTARFNGAGARPPQRATVLAAVADYILAHGVANLSLRSIARAVGTSHRMLLYHFGSKEHLLRAAIQEARTRDVRTLTRAIARHGPPTPPEVVHRMWRWYASPRRARLLRSAVEVWAVSLQQPPRCQDCQEPVARNLVGFAADGLVAAGYSPAEGRARASLYVGALRGLLLDLLATGDRARLEAAVGLLGKAIERDLATIRERRRAPSRVDRPPPRRVR
jgi:AcrR family transcriptional regulator